MVKNTKRYSYKVDCVNSIRIYEDGIYLCEMVTQNDMNVDIDFELQAKKIVDALELYDKLPTKEQKCRKKK